MPVSAGDSTRILVSGKVQGVGYRYFATARAKMRGIVGYVRNLPDGNVEVVAAGPRAALADFIGDLERGPSSGRVHSCQVAAIPLTEQFSEFSVRY
ncbi:MAG: acylphosphatase [Candidatus Latescibacteria bacterium]|nr:acylphosphatase [Candidatus Latescibacterota bacterium]